MIQLKRIYDPPRPEDGQRFLVERLWPRGIARADARLTGWLRELAPSAGLRRWFHHDPARWEEFRRRYRAELEAPEAVAALQQLVAASRTGAVTLVFAAKDRQRNSAVVLKEAVEALATGG